MSFSVVQDKNDRIYLDHNATTPVAMDVIESLEEIAVQWGNPSSIHWSGREPKAFIRDARKRIAKMIGCQPLEFIFTSGGSEANNTAVKGVYFQNIKNKKEELHFRNKYIFSVVEHPSLIESMAFLERQGMEVVRIPVSRDGLIDLKTYEEALDKNTALVSVMWVNNETGTIFPIKKMTEMAHKVGALFHTDSVQALGKIPIDVYDLNVDFASFSAHKFYSLKGTGVLYCKSNVSFESLIHGGGQERGRRAGTENTLGVAAFSKMAEKAQYVVNYGEKILKLRKHMERRILDEISNVTVTCVQSERVAHCSSLVIGGVDGETLLMSLDMMGYSVSTGAACSSGNPEPSPTLIAMGLSREEAQNSLRLSLGWENTLEEINSFVDVLKTEVKRLRQLHHELGNMK